MGKEEEEKCVDPDAPREVCLACAGEVFTCERKEPVEDPDGVPNYICPIHPDGVQMEKGWVCSSKCWDLIADMGD